MREREGVCVREREGESVCVREIERGRERQRGRERVASCGGLDPVWDGLGKLHAKTLRNTALCEMFRRGEGGRERERERERGRRRERERGRERQIERDRARVRRV